MAHNRITKYFRPTHRFRELEKQRQSKAIALRVLNFAPCNSAATYQYLYALAYEQALASVASSKCDFDGLLDDWAR